MRTCALAIVFTAAVYSVAHSASAPAALGLDANRPIAVNADNFLADLNGETGTYTGNVVVSQGNVKLHADRVTVSAPGGRASRMEASGHVVVDTPSGQAIGDAGVYDVAARTLRLTGNVVLTKDSNVLRGTALEVSMATGIARLTAGEAAAGQASNPSQGRVQGLFAPAPDSSEPADRGQNVR